MKYLIVDDNKMARMALKQLASQIKGIELVEECSSAIEAYNIIAKTSIDFVLLDIEMPEYSGLEFAHRIASHPTYIIFTTGKSEYAVDAFERNVVDYILKPVTLPRLITAIDKLKYIQTDHVADYGKPLDFFFVKDRGSLVRVLLDDILYIEAMGDYVKIHTQNKFYTVHSTLKKIEDGLDKNNFIKVHRSNIVSIRHIEKIEEGVIFIHLHRISVSDSYKSLLFEKLNLI